MYSHYSHHQDLVDQERKKSKIRMTFAIRARSIKQPCGTPWIPRGIALVIFFLYLYSHFFPEHLLRLPGGDIRVVLCM